MKLTIGMASYNNHPEVWHVVQALRLYQDLSDTEILVVDNYGDDNLKNFISHWCQPHARYVRFVERQGTAPAKQRVFDEARGEWVICVDSHVLLQPGALARFRDWADAHPDCMDLLHGPMLYDDLRNMADAMNPTWGNKMWGQWRGAQVKSEADPYEIPMHGMGLFACRKDAWLGFNPAFRGFGAEEGYIHEKFRKGGRKVILLPWLRWLHYFRPMDKAAPYPALTEDQAHNYEVGFTELGLDQTEFRNHFGLPLPAATTGHPVKPAACRPAISCVMPTYRRMTCVERSVSLWLEQTYRDAELVIYNTDVDHPVTLGASSADQRIKVINSNRDLMTGQPYNNVGAIRRDALKHASGKYYVCWDDDDIFLPWDLQQCHDRITAHPGIWAWKPVASMWQGGGRKIELAQNVMEASIIVDMARLRECGFVQHPGGGEHMGWIEAFGDKLMIDDYSIPAYSFNWSDPPEIGGHKQSSTIDAVDNFERHKLGVTDFHTRPIERIDVSGIIEEYRQFLRSQPGLHQDLIERYVGK